MIKPGLKEETVSEPDLFKSGGLKKVSELNRAICMKRTKRIEFSLLKSFVS